jgi:hypothetical protein
VLDVHPRVAHWIEDVGVPVVFTEGTKKADSIISAAHREDTDILTVAISGVWNFLSEGEPIPDMHEIPVNGRKVYIGFDSDVFRNPDVSDAARRLAGHLEGQGAEVCLFYLTGADLSGASLNSADLAGTHLHGANLSGAMGLTDWQITAAQSLEGATMPNGQQYEEWLKDKKAKGKDEKNE